MKVQGRYRAEPRHDLQLFLDKIGRLPNFIIVPRPKELEEKSSMGKRVLLFLSPRLILKHFHLYMILKIQLLRCRG